MTDETQEPQDHADATAQEGAVEETSVESAEASEAATDQPQVTPDAGDLQAQVAELQDRLLREQAELENFRRRSQREMLEQRKYQGLNLVRDLLPALDNLDRAVQAAEQTGEVGNLLEGIRMVSQQMVDTLKSHSAEKISAEGESFDPNLHEALSQVPTPDHPPMTVIQVVETGFKMHDRVVRPAKVIVSCAPPAPAADDAAAE